MKDFWSMDNAMKAVRERGGIPVMFAPFGSRLYGTDRPDSDRDYIGVYVGSFRDYLVPNGKKTIDVSSVSKDENGKNDADAVDATLFELLYFAKLVMKGSTNHTEILFVPEDELLYGTSFWDDFVTDAREKIVSKRSVIAFISYAKKEYADGLAAMMNEKAIREAKKVLEKSDPKADAQSVLSNFEYAVKVSGGGSFVGDVLVRSITVKDALARFEKRLEALRRKTLLDPKRTAHAIRLLEEAIELAETGKITFPRPNADVLRDVASGKFDPVYAAAKIEELVRKAEEALDNTKLPERPDEEAVERIVTGIVARSFGIEKSNE